MSHVIETKVDMVLKLFIWKCLLEANLHYI